MAQFFKIFNIAHRSYVVLYSMIFISAIQAGVPEKKIFYYNIEEKICEKENAYYEETKADYGDSIVTDMLIIADGKPFRHIVKQKVNGKLELTTLQIYTYRNNMVEIWKKEQRNGQSFELKSIATDKGVELLHEEILDGQDLKVKILESNRRQVFSYPLQPKDTIWMEDKDVILHQPCKPNVSTPSKSHCYAVVESVRMPENDSVILTRYTMSGRRISQESYSVFSRNNAQMFKLKLYNVSGRDSIIYVYDKVGNLTTRRELFPKGSLKSRRRVTYDAAGNWIKDDLTQYYDNGQISLAQRFEQELVEGKDSALFSYQGAMFDRLGTPINYAPYLIDIYGEPMSVLNQSAEFPGGEKMLREFVQKNLRYPPFAAENGIQGKVTLSFFVEEDGSVGNIEIMRSPAEELSKEVIRVVSAMPKWEPANLMGKKIRTKYICYFTFKNGGQSRIHYVMFDIKPD